MPYITPNCGLYEQLTLDVTMPFKSLPQNSKTDLSQRPEFIKYIWTNYSHFLTMTSGFDLSIRDRQTDRDTHISTHQQTNTDSDRHKKKSQRLRWHIYTTTNRTTTGFNRLPVDVSLRLWKCWPHHTLSFILKRGGVWQ